MRILNLAEARSRLRRDMHQPPNEPILNLQQRKESLPEFEMLWRRDTKWRMSTACHRGGLVRVKYGVEDEPNGADNIELDDGSPGESFGSERLNLGDEW